MNELALFAGAGGGILGGKLLGWRTVCAVEWEQYPASVLCARQNDGLLPPFPIWDDVQTFDGNPWRGIVDVVSGGFPCQDISVAGKGDGLDGERSGMWTEMARIIHEVRPKFVFVENSPMLTSRGLGRVLGDLASMGFDAKWGVLGAADIGANHQRDRIWIVAHSNSMRKLQPKGRKQDERGWISNSSNEMAHSNSNGFNYSKQGKLGKSPIQAEAREKSNQIGRHTTLAHSNNERLQRGELFGDNQQEIRRRFESAHGATAKCSPTYGTKADWWDIEPDVGRVAHGVVARVDRLKAIGNGQVPLCAATAWRILSESL
jgi:DNA (cytosine-5)-methyltransferase 1